VYLRSNSISPEGVGGELEDVGEVVVEFGVDRVAGVVGVVAKEAGVQMH
jgi:hypothetical protein